MRYIQQQGEGTMERRTISGSSPYEPIVGYSRAVRVGDTVYVAGTTATDASGNVVGVGDPYAQKEVVVHIISAHRSSLCSPIGLVPHRLYRVVPAEGKIVHCL